MGEAKGKREALAKTPCRCGSMKPARECCFDGFTWRKSPALLGLKTLPTTHAVERCYMAELNSCDGGISGEHLISESVMRLLAGEGEFTIEGLPWIPLGEQRSVGFKSLIANCLCAKHNSALHYLDDAALSFFHALRTCCEDDTKEHNFLVNGHDIERWLLKTLKAMAVSGNLARSQQRLPGVFASHIGVVEMLDHPENWPIGSGLYCLMQAGELTQNHNRFQLQPIMNSTGDLIGLWSNIIGLSFALSLEPNSTNMLPALVRAQYRPPQISIQRPQFNSNIKSNIKISWTGERSSRHTLALKYQGRVTS